MQTYWEFIGKLSDHILNENHNETLLKLSEIDHRLIGDWYDSVSILLWNESIMIYDCSLKICKAKSIYNINILEVL